MQGTPGQYLFEHLVKSNILCYTLGLQDKTKNNICFLLLNFLHFNFGPVLVITW